MGLGKESDFMLKEKNVGRKQMVDREKQMRKIIKGILLIGLAISFGQISLLYAEIIPSERLVTWQGNVGVLGGIPNRASIYTTLSPSGGDDTLAIQKALNSCPANQVVKLNPGTFLISGVIDWQGVADGVVLRGSGPTNTTMQFSSGFIVMRRIFSEPSLSVDLDLITDAVKGESRIRTATKPAWLLPGHYYIIDQLDDPSFVSGAGIEGGYSYREIVGNGARGLGQLNKVTSIEGTGPYTINLEIPLYYGFKTASTAQIAEAGYDPTAYTMRYQCGIEDLKLTATYTNGDAQMIKMENCSNCWIKNIESYNSPGGSHISTAFCYRLEIRDSYFHDSHVYGAGQGYGISLYHVTGASLIENNIFSGYHVAMMACYGSSGNVFGYNYAFGGTSTANQEPSISTHGVHAYMNLWEGNYVANKVLGDFIHGSSSHNTIFRNRILGYESGKTLNQMVVSLEKYNRKWNIVGNILGTSTIHTIYDACPSGCAVSTCTDSSKIIYDLGFPYSWGCGGASPDDLAIGSAIRHGNYDYVNNATVWDSGISDHVIPNSYYLSSKPLFFGDLAWPSFGPDLDPMVGSIPAINRFERDRSGLQPPTNVRIMQQ